MNKADFKTNFCNPEASHSVARNRTNCYSLVILSFVLVL